MDNQATQQILVQLAAAAASPNLTQSTPNLPYSWKALTSKSAFTSNIGHVQLLLAFGNVGSETISCLAIGQPWPNFIGNYSAGFEIGMQQLPEDVAGTTSSTETVMSLYVAAYQFLRGTIWESLSFLKSDGVPQDQLHITGMGLGAPLAQIAAIDLRPGHRGPNDELAPQATQPVSFVFSAGNFASPDFKEYYNKNNTKATNTIAGTDTLEVDKFPLAPAADQGFVPLGTVNQVQAAIPSPYYTPWEVRDSNYYLTTLGGMAVPGFPTKTTISAIPGSGFDQSLAFSMGTYTEYNYRLGLKPATPPEQVDPLKTYDFGSSKAIAAIYKTATSLIVTFRGSITWEEFLSMDANSRTATDPYNQQITSGTQTILYQIPPVDSESDKEKPPCLSDQIIGDIEENAGDLQLYITGHGFGGALANTFALGMAQNTAVKAEIDAIYTFGANYFAGHSAAGTFKDKFGSKSYQVLRPDDKVATALKAAYFWYPADYQVVLNGTLNETEDTYHSLSSYLKLLDPQRVQP